MGRKAIGIDLGGTDIKAGVVDETGRILSRVKVPTEVPKGRKVIIRNIARAADLARRNAGLTWRQIAAAGLGSPCVFAAPNGLVCNCPNIKCLERNELARPVSELLPLKGKPFALDSDAILAAFGEAWAGAGKGVKSLVLMTLGTGVGGGLVLNGELWRGSGGSAALLGHQTLFPDGIRCGCGGIGCLEAYASATALVRRLHEAIAAGKRTRLTAKIRKGGQITAEDITSAAKVGDRLCLGLTQEIGKFLGIAAVNMIHVLNVDMIVFAGGMTAAGMVLLKPIRDTVRERAIPMTRRHVKIVFSRLGNDAGLIGAAGYGLSQARGARKRKAAR